MIYPTSALTMNILLIYPNINGQRQVQMGLASISSVLKEQGHNIALFDTTFIIDEPFDGIASKLRDKINDFKPDLLLRNRPNKLFTYRPDTYRDNIHKINTAGLIG